MQQTECNYWVERATNAGLSQFEITTLLMRSSEALPDQVRRREEMRRQANRGERENKVSVEGNTLELSVVFAIDPKEHHVEMRRIELKNGNYVEIWAPPTIGQPTEFDLNVLLACFMLSQKNGYQEYEATDFQIAEALGMRDCGRFYKNMEKAFDRLSMCTIKTNNWLNPETKERVTIANFNFFQKYEYNGKTRKHKVRFSEWLERSIEARYLKQIDIVIARKLRGATKVIHLNVIKLVGKKKYFEMSEELVLRWLGKWEKYQNMEPKQRNRNIKRYIDPSVQAAVEGLGLVIRKEKNIYQYRVRSY